MKHIPMSDVIQFADDFQHEHWSKYNTPYISKGELIKADKTKNILMLSVHSNYAYLNLYHSVYQLMPLPCCVEPTSIGMYEEAYKYNHELHELWNEWVELLYWSHNNNSKLRYLTNLFTGKNSADNINMYRKYFKVKRLIINNHLSVALALNCMDLNRSTFYKIDKWIKDFKKDDLEFLNKINKNK